MTEDNLSKNTQRHDEPLNDYFVITKLAEPRTRPIRWTWQIRRRSEPLGGVEFDGDEYATAQDAKLAGETALKDFLRNLADLRLRPPSHTKNPSRN